MITCKNIVKDFGKKRALDDVSVEIPQGRIYGLLGPNGAGKTTLIRIINRITFPDSGQVLFGDRPITDGDVRKIGYLPEERGLYRKMEVGDQAMYLAMLRGMSASEARQSLSEWFERFEIKGWWHKKVEELSKGMAQKVQFITTVAHRPSLLILDEPFSGFDPVNAAAIRAQILRLRDEGATIILSTHNMESVEELCDDITLINQSRTVISGSVNEIRSRYGNHTLEMDYQSEAPLQAGEVFDIVSDTEADGVRKAVIAVKDGRPVNDALSCAIASGVQVQALRKMMPRMNDIFIKLVTEGV